MMEQYTGKQKYKGNKLSCQESKISVWLHNLFQPKRGIGVGLRARV